MNIEQRYRYHRSKGTQAKWAILSARIDIEWEEAGEAVRLRILPDEFWDFENLFGDMFSPSANPSISPERLEREKQQEIQRINDEGVWGIVGEYRCSCCNAWTPADAVWGFVGDDWIDSGYDVDVKRATLEEMRTE